MTHPHFVPPNSVPQQPGPPAFVTPPNVAPVVPSPSSPQESVLLETTSEMPILGRSNVDAPAEPDHATDEPAATTDEAIATDEPEAPAEPAAADEPTDEAVAVDEPEAPAEPSAEAETETEPMEAPVDSVLAELTEAAEEVAEAKAQIEEAQADLDEAQSDLAEAGEAIEDSIQDSASLEDTLPEDDTVTETPYEVEEPEAYVGTADLVADAEVEEEYADEDEEDLYEEQYSEDEPVAALRPGDIEETTIAIWDPEVAERYREAWRDIQAHFVDEPEAALGEAQDLVAEAVQALADALLAEQVSLDPHEEDETPDTESLRMAMRGYRDFLERVLAL